MDTTQKKRKYQLPDFRDLFSALFKIKDLDVQNRVLDAINGITSDTDTHCGYCGNRKNIKTIEISTQTNNNLSMQTINSVGDAESDNSSKKEDSCSRFIRKRKRAKKIPRVEKSSPVKAKPELISGKHEKVIKKDQVPAKIVDDKDIAALLEVSNETLADIFCELDIIKPNKIPIGELDLKMKQELIDCLQFLPNNKMYLPIHQAIITNDLRKLKLQKFVLKYRKVKLNELYTKSENPENPIQLAIKANCIPKVLTELFEYGNEDENNNYLNDIDCNQNTLIHLAMLNLENDNIATFKVLIDKVQDLNILCETNDNGQTALHIGVNINKPIFCQLLLLKIDAKLKIPIKMPKSFTLSEKILLEFYTKQMNSIGTGEIMLLNKEKMKIINAIDLKHGKTPLLFAIAKKNRLLTLMLLYNGADPRIKDYSQNDYFESEDIQLQSILSNANTYLEKCSQII